MCFEAKTFLWLRGANSTLRLFPTKEAELFASEKLFASMLKGQNKEGLGIDSLSRKLEAE
jgi:hypothetical protein